MNQVLYFRAVGAYGHHVPSVPQKEDVLLVLISSKTSETAVCTRPILMVSKLVQYTAISVDSDIAHFPKEETTMPSSCFDFIH